MADGPPVTIKTAEETDPEERKLPMLRADLRMYRGPDEDDGSPTFSLFDPVRAQYFKIKWAEALVVKYLRPGMTLGQLKEVISQHSTLRLSNEEVMSFFEDSQKSALLETPRTSEMLAAEAKARHINPIMWLLYHYLYIKIPLVNPDRFLTATVGGKKYTATASRCAAG